MPFTDDDRERMVRLEVTLRDVKEDLCNHLKRHWKVTLLTVGALISAVGALLVAAISK